jgi:hypothetical protein
MMLKPKSSKKQAEILFAVLLPLLIVGLISCGDPMQGRDVLAVIGVNIVQDAKVTDDWVLVVENGVYKHSEPRPTAPIPAGSAKIDGRPYYAVAGKAEFYKTQSAADIAKLLHQEGEAMEDAPRFEAGQPADFILLDKNPLEDATATWTPAMVFVAGQRVDDTAAEE